MSLLIVAVLLVVDRRYIKIGTALCMFLVGPVAGFFLPVNGRWIEALVDRICRC